MVNPGKTLSTCLAFSFAGRSSALYLPDSKYSDLTAANDHVEVSLHESDSALEKRRRIDVNVIANSVIAVGTTIIAAKAGIDIYEFIANAIKTKSDLNSCQEISGTDSNGIATEGYFYKATTTGDNCDTTSETKTMVTAVSECADHLNSYSATRGCCDLTHGGTWTGTLCITANPDRYPAADASY